MNAASKPYDGVNGYIRITDIDEVTFNFKREGIVSPDAEIDENYRVAENDILFARTGASTGKTYLYKPEDGKLYFAGFLIRAKVDSKYDSRFLFYQTQTRRYKKWVQIMSMRSGQPGINSQEFASYLLNIPEITEQKRIASLLELIDKRIVVQNKVIEDLRSLYDVICQKLYSSNEKKEWHEFKYADLLTISNERNSRLQYTNVLSASQEYGMVERGELNIDIKYDATSIKNYKIVHPNEYVIHLRSFQGGFAYSDKTGICSPAYTILVPNGKLIPAFLKYYFTSTQFINSLRIVTYGIRDGRSISVEEFLQLKISIPTISEQHYILSVMQLWEEKIRIEECHLSNLQKQKQYLLRQMFI